MPLPRRRCLLKPVLLLHARRLHSTAPRPSGATTTTRPSIEYPLTHPIYTIWAADTALGKTLVSAGLSMSFLSSSSSTNIGKKFVYLKPVQTGFPEDSDSRFVYRKFSDFFLQNRPRFSVKASNQVLKTSLPASNALLEGKIASLESGTTVRKSEGSNVEHGFENLQLNEERELRGLEKGGAMGVRSELLCKTMYGWKEAISPHLAAEREGATVEDYELLEMLKRGLAMGIEGNGNQDLGSLCVIETAGGVASPGPSGTLQCDLYRPFRLPAILVGDGRLGGISATISAYESLKLRGYDIVAVVFEDHGLVNEVPLSSYLQNSVPVFLLPRIPKDSSDDLIEWFDKSQPIFTSLKERMLSAFVERVQRLNDMPKRARDIVWWPFTQHQTIPEENVTVIDSRCGENFAVYKGRGLSSITEQFDGSASWWTQAPDAKLQVELAKTIGYTAARYGHVLFPGNVYEPVLECSELLLEGVGKGWASRVFFSDNGSTSVEVALRMAFRKFLFDHGIHFDRNAKSDRDIDLKVLGLRGCYHGDTLGALEAQAPSYFSDVFQQPWFTERGLFLDSPTLFMSHGVWKLELPEKIQAEKSNKEDVFFNVRDEIFETSRDSSSLARIYSSYISKQLSVYDSGTFPRIGALIMEPVIQGAAGMKLFDPLFQRVLVRECRSRKIPVIFDEVFTGFWHLGVECAARLLHCQPDISCFAKVLSGGTVPLSATLASEDIFKIFNGDTELEALLYGHTYTGHAIGCSAAVTALKWLKNPETNSNMLPGGKSLKEFWDPELVRQISSHPAIERVVTLGTFFAFELRGEGSDLWFLSRFSTSLVEKLLEDGISVRPLGNVVYIMCTPCTLPQTCSEMLKKVSRRLDEFSTEQSEPKLAQKRFF